MTTIESVTDATFQEAVLAAPGTTVVEFWAEWCGPCRALSPILQQLQEEHADRIRIVKINADENMESTVAYKALALPVMKVFRDGEVVKTIIGAKPKPAMEMELAPFL
ncbi:MULTISPECIES: co-chaperone YbbN [Microbacteriaceae]|jgi:thioredoxin 1|uniref:thioredoxin family protein n=1 Tax=Microbacteriaceae TaxID=85023 RepID=UPI00037287AA|nr:MULTISPECIES: thioredoxin domain-containing protein [Microbacteriaceae]MDR6613450.1 thioredoxin 1 [Leifsonia sp. 1010]SDH38468.1 thioredoxin [Leifsonia sp. 197AMF]SDI97663.1 thioredoxin [Leifsonia sp. 466MF]SDJ77468.1 thioredoxin [Leifsonia sp. 157MF]SDO01029.1 thioredoxin [Leifsonia sp. 509MF]